MSLEKKVLGLIAALNGAGCADENYSITLGGVVISEAVTDNDGKASFTEEGTDEEVPVELTISDTDFPIADATILYFDHPEFKAFSIFHPAFAPQLNIAEHNSGHKYSLTPAPLQILHDSSQKERSKKAAGRLLSWVEAGWEHTGCLNKGNMVTLMKPGVFAMKVLTVFETIGFSDRHLDQAAEYIEQNLPESAVADVYVFIPSKYGFRATTTITALDVKVSGECAYNSSGNQSNDYGSNNESSNNTNGSNDCPGMLFCDYFKGTSLNTNKWNVISDMGIEVYGSWLSLPNASSIAAQKSITGCIDKSIELRGILAGGALSLGNGIELYTTPDLAKLVCGENEVNADVYMDTENIIEVEKSNGSLYLRVNGNAKAALPCLASPSSLQFTAGFNNLVEIDYVEVKCK